MKHILIVEDQPSGRFILSKAFKRSGYLVTAVGNGFEALEVIERPETVGQKKIDLVLTDIDMPKMSGAEMMDVLIEKKIDLPVVVMTAYSTKDLVIELMRKGCPEYIEKPYEPFDVVLCVDRVLEKEEKIKLEKTKAEQEELKQRKKLETVLGSYKLYFNEMRQEMETVKDTYRNIIDINNKDLEINVAYHLQAFSDLGGDFIDIKKTSRGYDVLIADVAGHDLAASFHNLIIKTLFRENIQQEKTGVEFFKSLNHILLDEGENERMVTALFMNLDLKENICEVVSAGHPYPTKIEKKYLVTRPIIVEGDVLGIHNKVKHKPHVFSLTEGMKIFLHTDGFADIARVNSRTGKKEILGTEGIDKLIKKYVETDINILVKGIWDDACKFCKYEFKDDASILGIEIPVLEYH